MVSILQVGAYQKLLIYWQWCLRSIHLPDDIRSVLIFLIKNSHWEEFNRWYDSMSISSIQCTSTSSLHHGQASTLLLLQTSPDSAQLNADIFPLYFLKWKVINRSVELSNFSGVSETDKLRFSSSSALLKGSTLCSFNSLYFSSTTNHEIFFNTKICFNCICVYVNGCSSLLNSLSLELEELDSFLFIVHKLMCNVYRLAWFPLNVSVIATNWSCLLARTLLRFAGFHKQPSFGLLRGLLYLEACKSRSASSI